MTHRIIAFYSVCCWLVFLSANGCPPSAAAQPPNVVLILADDLGWSDTTLFGTTKLYRTPHLERLASRGMTFTRAYSASPLCSPTRASVLTGLSPARHGITAPQCHLPQVLLDAVPQAVAAPNQKATQPKSATRLRTEHQTLAETLRAAGYATGHFGKWHLGPEPYSPLQHGFEVDIPHWPGPGPAGSYVAPWKFPDFDHDPDVPDQHIEDRMAQEAVAFIKQHRDEPFFLNYWMFSVHAPFDAKRDLIEAYRARVDPKDPQRCPTYAAMIESMDDAIGTLLDTLDELGITQNTVIIFASDNGGNMYNMVEGERPTSNRPLRGGKATLYEGGIRGPAVIAWPGEVVPGSRSDQIIQSMDYYPTLLEIIGLQPDRKLDGLSLVPALREKPLQRDAIFTYFPHSPGVPDWLPPAISVHQGDWKLIRIFFGGEKGQHRWTLFDLGKDLGEQHDLANSHPQKVAELDQLIERHLQETGAIVPSINPNFDPDRYDASREGIQFGPTKSGSQKANVSGGAAVDGWSPIRNCKLTRLPDALRVDCVGGDPHFGRDFSQPLPPGEYRVTLQMRSESGGTAQWYWSEANVRPKFIRDRSVSLPLGHHGTVQQYQFTMTASHPITAIRLDPLQVAGKVWIKSLTIATSDNQMVKQWQYE